MPKIKHKNESTWQSGACNATLKHRALFLQKIRRYFEQHDVVEVDPPLLMSGVNSDPHLNAFQVGDKYLQTSPEFAMKRLLAQGMGDIYYLGKAFRHAEVGQVHNPEFTLLEWYRCNWGLSDLLSEVSAFCQLMIEAPAPTITPYAKLFGFLGIDPHEASTAELKKIARAKMRLPDFTESFDRTDWLEWLFNHLIEPRLDPAEFTVVVDYPVDCAQLAKRLLHDTHHQVAARFEVYYQGFELANGYDELQDAQEQKERFEADLLKRDALNKQSVPIDEKLLAALEAGLPSVCGVALGVDRLFMLNQGIASIEASICFDWRRS